jgi:ATP-dependent RNA helicase HelY
VLRAAIRQHPVHACPERADHLRWASRWYELDRDTQGKRRAVESRTGTIARQFDRICEVLDALKYLDGDAVTAEGSTLSRLYSELDLVAAECLRTGVWEELDPPSLAAALTGLVYESRNPDDAVAPRLPRGAVRDAVHRMHGTWADLHRVETEHKVSFLRPPDFGFAWAAWRWASGAALHEVIDESEMTAGDFVRQCKQLLDVVDQVADAAGAGDLRTTARQAADALRRGVVAYSSLGS